MRGAHRAGLWQDRLVQRLIIAAAMALVPQMAMAQTATTPSPEVNTTRLGQLLGADGFQPPDQFKALVGQVVIPRSGAAEMRWFDWEGTSDDRDDWWPGSSIKLYAAIAALERNRELGFSPAARVTYHYEDADIYRAPLSEVVRLAIVPSNNHAFNRLVEFVGFDRLNREFFTDENGLGSTVFLRAYSSDRVDPETGHGVNRAAPRLTISEGERRESVPASLGRGRFQCPDQGNCTTLLELGESIRRVMLHDRLPESERFDLGTEELELLRETLEAPRRPHGATLVESLRNGFGPDAEVRIYHKPGYAYRWSSDVIFVHRVDTQQCWVIALAAHSGRRVIDEALTRIGSILGRDQLLESDAE